MTALAMGVGREAMGVNGDSTARGLVSAENFSFWYGETQALRGISLAVCAARRDGVDRPVRLRQVDVPAVDQPHERAAPGRAP